MVRALVSGSMSLPNSIVIAESPSGNMRNILLEGRQGRLAESDGGMGYRNDGMELTDLLLTSVDCCQN